MDRRRFIKGLGTAGALAATPWLSGCSDDSSPAATSGRPTTTRRPTTTTTLPLRPIERPPGDGPWVVVLGGGVGGMSAAHELRERGVPVTVLERKAIPGGKARSVAVPDTATGDRLALPGEHGFRFFPGFYRHLPDTMQRIPFEDNAKGVFDNLVPAGAATFARDGGRPEITLPLVKLDVTIDNVTGVFNKLFTDVFGLTGDEAHHFSTQMGLFLTSCDERRLAEYEQLDWWSYVGADQFSDEYRKLLAIGATRNFVASRAEQASARTVALMMAQFLNQLISAGDHLDQVLDGPTNEVWIAPWLEHLTDQGVDYHLDAHVTEIAFEDGRITGAVVDRGRGPELVEADEYICALPVEVARTLLVGDVRTAAPELAALDALQVEWMNGIQYYLTEPTPIVEGHVNFVDSPWALTSISQQQFWPAHVLETGYGDGEVRDCLSVDISNWDDPGIVHRKPARECTSEEIAEEVWAQLQAHLNNAGAEVLPDRILHSYHLDDSITFPKPGEVANDEPLLVNTAGSLFNRPHAQTSIENLYLASDYVRTTIDLATMEGANEAARAAVNAIIDRHDLGVEPCATWPLEEPAFLVEFREYDEGQFAEGKPNLFEELGFPRG